MPQRPQQRSPVSPVADSRVTRFIAAGQRALADNRHDDAAREFRAALRLAPSLVPVHQALGVSLTKAGRFEEAVNCLRGACAMAPANFDLQLALADAFYLGGHVGAALPEYIRATQLNPNSAVAWSNVGAIYLRGSEPNMALRALHNSISIDPTFPLALGNSALAFIALGEFAVARESLDAALALKPDYNEMHWNRAIMDLIHGDFERGWAGHEYRWVEMARHGAVQKFSEPRWNGQRFDGQTLLLWAEQGLGDQLQFARFIPLVKALGGTVILQCSEPLKRLIAHSCPAADEVVTSVAEAGSFDLQAPIMSLPFLLKLGANVGGERVPYLRPPAAMSNAIAQVLPEPHRKLRVGVIWAGQPKHSNDRNRSLQLETLRPLLAVPDVEWFSVQKGDAAETQIEPFNAASIAAGSPTLTPLGPLFRDFVDTAHALARLDLVITVDTAVAHLAGGMGVPVWLMLPRVPDWRWQLDREDSPWYPTARIFRQGKVGDWTHVVESIRSAVECVASKRAPASSANVSVGRAA